MRTLCRRRYALRATAVFLTAVSAGYVLNTALYLTPPNPMKAMWLPIIYRIQHPLFAQNWHLFAPDPIRTNFVVTVRCRAGETITAWHDVTTPLLARHHRTRSSPLGRVLRVQQNAVHLVLGWSSDDWRALVCRRYPQVPLCMGTDAATEARREMGRIALRRVASAACDRLLGRGRSDAVQVRILVHTPPPWSQRHRPAGAGSTRYLSLPWEAYEAW